MVTGHPGGVVVPSNATLIVMVLELESRRDDFFFFFFFLNLFAKIKRGSTAASA